MVFVSPQILLFNYSATEPWRIPGMMQQTISVRRCVNVVMRLLFQFPESYLIVHGRRAKKYVCHPGHIYSDVKTTLAIRTRPSFHSSHTTPSHSPPLSHSLHSCADRPDRPNPRGETQFRAQSPRLECVICVHNSSAYTFSVNISTPLVNR